MLDLSIIILNWNTRDLLADCLTSIAETTEGLPLEVIVVDNASTDGSPEMVRERFSLVRLVANQANVGFARGNNQGVGLSHGRYLLLLNSDACLLPQAVQALLTLAEAQPRAGILGAQLLNADGSFQASHSCFPTQWQEFLILSGLGRMWYGRWYPSHGPEEDKGPQRVDYVEGACLLIRREAFDAAGGLDEDYFMYAEEVDWCYAMRAKAWEVWYQPAARVVHLGGGSSRTRRPEREGDLYRSRVRFFRKHYGNTSAELLKAQIYAFTTLKLVYHGLLHRVSRGRYGRPVVPLSYLARQLKEA